MSDQSKVLIISPVLSAVIFFFWQQATPPFPYYPADHLDLLGLPYASSLHHKAWVTVDEGQ